MQDCRILYTLTLFYRLNDVWTLMQTNPTLLIPPAIDCMAERHQESLSSLEKSGET